MVDQELHTLIHRQPKLGALIIACILRTIYRLCMKNLIQLLKRRNKGINIEINFTCVNLRLLLLLLRNLGSIHGHFIRFGGL